MKMDRPHVYVDSAWCKLCQKNICQKIICTKPVQPGVNYFYILRIFICPGHFVSTWGNSDGSFSLQEAPCGQLKVLFEAVSELHISPCSIWLHVHRAGPYIQGREKQVASMGNTEFILILLCANYCIIFHMNTENILFALPDIPFSFFSYIHLCCCIKCLPILFPFSLMLVHF